MTTAGGIGHTLPYLIPDFYTATAIAVIVVVIELLDHRLDPVAVHGDAADIGGRQGHARRRPGAGDRNPDRLKLRTRGPYDW